MSREEQFKEYRKAYYLRNLKSLESELVHINLMKLKVKEQIESIKKEMK